MCKGTLVFYINAIHEGGAERVIIQVAKRFAECGYRAILVTSFVDENEYDVPKEVERVTLEEKRHYRNKLQRNINRIIALRKVYKKYDPDAVISFMAEPNVRSVLANFWRKAKTIISVRNDPNREYAGWSGRFIGKCILPMADGCVFQTKEAKDWFPHSLQKKSQIIFNEVDHIFFKTEYIGGKDVVALGRLCNQKNHKLLIDAFANISDKHENINLLIYGIGPLENELKQYISSRNMDSRVFLKGLTTEANIVLSQARCFVLASDYEGMPNALLEALAIGVPSISTNCPCGGPRMLIEHEKNGLLVPVGDEMALSAAIDRLLSDERYAEILGAAAKERAKQYSPDKIFGEWKAFVEGVLQKEKNEKN